MGRPVHDDRLFFEFLILEGPRRAQLAHHINKAGVVPGGLRGFDAAAIARFGPAGGDADEERGHHPEPAED